MDLPAKGACYLLADEAGRPLLLSTTRNLRASIVNRMRPDAAEERTRRTDYAAVCQSVQWRPAFSRFEADWAHLELARRLMPDGYGEMIQHRRVWWLHVDPEADFPRFQVFRRPDRRSGRWIGPLPTRGAARSAIEALEEMLELCRYYEVLTQAPHGVACAYKEMGKCPAPCDGSVGMDDYRHRISRAADLLLEGLGDWRAEREAAMKAAAAELSFERAGAIKAELDRAAALEHDDLRCVGALPDMRRLVLMPGRRKGCVRAFAAIPGRLTFLGEMQRRQRPAQATWLATQAHAWLDTPMPKLDTAAIERLELVAWHMLRPDDQREGAFLARDDATCPEAILDTVERIAGPARRKSSAKPKGATSNPGDAPASGPSESSAPDTAPDPNG